MKIRVSSVITGLLALAIAVPALLSLKPDILPVTNTALHYLVASLAFRGWIAVALAILAFFFAIMGLIRKTLLNRGRIALTLAFALILASLGHVGIMAWRGLSPTESVQAKQKGDITVLEYNTAGGTVTMDSLATVIKDNQVDVVMLTETYEQDAKKLATLLANDGLNFQIFSNGKTMYDTAYSSSILLISTSLGKYVVDESYVAAKSNVHGVMAKPISGNGPVFAAVHPISPDITHWDAWRADMIEEYSTCADYENVIMGGDFNSTADHEAALHLDKQCADAGAQAEIGGLGTWPSDLPGFFSAPIDRVLTNSQYQGVSGKIVNVGESDHRGIIVRMRPTSTDNTKG